MKHNLISALLILILFGCKPGPQEITQPNIIFFLADDLGYGETGVYGQEIIKTPNIDALADNGMQFTQHYSGAPVCAPARYVVLTGQHAGHAYIRGNDEWTERGDVWDYEKASSNAGLEGQRPIPDNTITIGKVLQQAGYQTGIFGKWGLGGPESEGIPTLQGFDYFYGYNCQRQAHNLYPPHLWENTTKIDLDNELVAPGTKLDSGANVNDASSYVRYTQQDYAPEKIHQRALSFMERNRNNPFFMFYASPLPHLPLQAPPSEVDKYRSVIDDEEPYLGDAGYFPNQYPRATYATMIGYLDEQLGELVTSLKELGIYENTIIIFSSDNGPTYTGGVDFNYFNSAKPFLNDYGRTKGFVYEGGIRVPLIASWPNHIEPGSESDHISAFYDLMPTVCDIAGIEPPVDIDGISFKPALLNQPQQEHDFLYWEFPSYNGQQAVRMGKWKGIRKDIFDDNLAIELFDVESDWQEKNDVSSQYPEIVVAIERIMKAEHTPATNDRFKIKQLGD